MIKTRFVIASLMLLHLSQTYAATEVEMVNERTVDGEKQVYTVKALFQGAKSRYTFHTQKDAVIGSETYLISLDGGVSIYYIDSGKNTCHHASSEELLEISSSFMLKTTDKFKVKTTEGALHKVFGKEAADIHGLPVEHIRININFNTSYKYMFFSDRYKIERLVDVWVTPQIEGIYAQGSFQSIWEYTGDAELDQALRMIIGKGNNFQLRSEIKQSMTDKKGKESSALISQYVKSMTEIDDLPEDAFQLPECKEIDADKMEKNFKALLKALLKE